jgi:alcohol dehydrogenase
MLLPSVVRWNDRAVGDRYATLLNLSSVSATSSNPNATEALATRLEALAAAGSLNTDLSRIVEKSDLPELAAEAAEQWTGTFNPRPFNKDGAMEVYSCAY